MSNHLIDIVGKDVMVDYVIEQKIKKAQKIAYNTAPQALQKGTANYASTAAKLFPPPKSGSRSVKIDEKLYYRNVYNVINVLKLSDEDKSKIWAYDDRKFINAVRNKKYWAVLTYKDRGKHPDWKFFETKEMADKWKKIKYRGLYKWLWGAHFQDIGEKTPAPFRKLLSQSPSLQKEANLSSMKIQKNGTAIQSVIEYGAQGVDYFLGLAEKKIMKSSLNKTKNVIQKKIKKEIKNV